MEEIGNPSVNEITIKVEAIGLNFADIFAILGLYSATPKGSFTPGLEFSGQIVEVGENVKNFQCGDRVMGVTRFGGYSTFLNIDSRYVKKLPLSWSYEEGAGFITQALTAYYALFELGNLKKGQTVLIHSGAGGVGIYANRIAKKFGTVTIGTVGSLSKLSILREEGYDFGIVRSKNFYSDLVHTLNEEALHLVLECIGGHIFDDSYKALSPTGRMVVYGFADFTPSTDRVNYLKLAYNYWKRPRVEPLNLVSDNKSVMGFNLIWLWDKFELLSVLLEQLIALNLAPQRIGKVFPFFEALQALEYFKSGKSVGKVVLKV